MQSTGLTEAGWGLTPDQAEMRPPGNVRSGLGRTELQENQKTNDF